MTKAQLVKGVNCDWPAFEPNAKTVETGKLVEALEATEKWWMIGKGQAKPGEPLYGCIISEPEIDGRVLARVEGNDLAFCMIEAIERVNNSK